MQDPAVDLPRWGFAFPGPLRDELTALALAGTKTTTAGLLVEHELDGDPIPRPGDRAILVDSVERPVAIIETVACRVVRLADVDDRHAIDEGEGYANAHEFRVAHERFWNGYIDDLRVRLGEPGFAITDDTPIVAERFRVLARLDTPPGPVPVRPAASSEVPVLAGVLARAFAADPMVRWPMVTDDELPARIRTMFEIVDTAFAGEGWIARGRRGARRDEPAAAGQRRAGAGDRRRRRAGDRGADPGRRRALRAVLGLDRIDAPAGAALAAGPGRRGAGGAGAGDRRRDAALRDRARGAGRAAAGPRDGRARATCRCTSASGSG